MILSLLEYSIERSTRVRLEKPAGTYIICLLSNQVAKRWVCNPVVSTLFLSSHHHDYPSTSFATGAIHSGMSKSINVSLPPPPKAAEEEEYDHSMNPVETCGQTMSWLLAVVNPSFITLAPCPPCVKSRSPWYQMRRFSISPFKRVRTLRTWGWDMYNEGRSKSESCVCSMSSHLCDSAPPIMASHRTCVLQLRDTLIL